MFWIAVEKPQTMLYSATMPDWVRRAASKYLSDDYKMISLVDKTDEQTAVTIKVSTSRSKYLSYPAFNQNLKVNTILHVKIFIKIVYL